MGDIAQDCKDWIFEFVEPNCNDRFSDASDSIHTAAFCGAWEHNMQSLGVRPQTHSVVGADSRGKARLKRQVDPAVEGAIGTHRRGAMLLAWLAAAMVRGQRTADADLLQGGWPP